MPAAKDPNVRFMAEYGRIQQLTKAVDALIAREYAVEQKMEMLGDLEAAVAEAETLFEIVEIKSAEIQQRCALLRAPNSPGAPRAHVGSDGAVDKLWMEHGAAMHAQLKRHMARFANLYKQITEVQDVVSP